jgi:nicotinamidase-related amidase
MAEDNIQKLLLAWRKSKLPVIIVQHCSSEPDSPLREGRIGNELKDFVHVLPGEKLVKKSTTSAFIDTDLLEYLQDHSIGNLVFTGFVTNNSVEATVRTAGDLGFRNVVVSDATACFDKTGHDGSKYDSHLIHEISLSNLNGEYAAIKQTQEILNRK